MSVPQSASMESILDRFEDAWNGPTPPCIEDYLQSCEPAKRFALLVELVRIDLERRLTRGERIRLDEVYLPRFPNLKADRAALISLTAHEYDVRRRREPNLSPHEYLERWPQYRHELIGLLALHPTLPTNGKTRDKSPAFERQDNEETRDVLAFLSPSQGPDELGRLASYRILKMLGAGGMGVVFLAEDEQLKRLVALKLMRPSMAVNTSARQRFVREAQAMAALKHDRIVTIYQVGEDRGVPFLAMEYLEGETLHERLKRETALPLTEVLRIGREIAEGLDAAHVRGLIHRDIKPANIWLENRSDPRLLEPRPSGSEQPRVKLLDFGLARAASRSAPYLTQTGVIVGTPSFMSPEQSRGEGVDHRSDLFSLGCVLYLMLTSQLPFKGRDMVSTLLSLNNDHPKPAREVNPHVPPSVNNLIQRLLAKNIADRPSSSEEVVKALQTLATEPEPILPPPARPQPASTPHRRRLISATLVALTLFGLTAMMAAIIIRIKTPDGKTKEMRVPEGTKIEVVHEKDVVPQEPPVVQLPPSEEAWLKKVAALSPLKQVEAVSLRLKERNPGFDGKVELEVIKDGKVTEIRFPPANVSDISPFRVLVALNSFNCANSKVSDISPLRALVGLDSFNCANSKVSDLSPLRGMKLSYLDCSGTRVSDLSPLKGMPLKQLVCRSTQPICDLSPLKGMPLTQLDITGTGVADLSPLENMKLTELSCGAASVSDLSPLKGMPLMHLACHETKVSDLSPLKGMPLSDLECGDTRVSDLSPLKGMPLTKLILRRTPANNLSPLKGIKLSILDIHSTKVSDLSPLEGIPLMELVCYNTQVSDLSPLKSMPLKSLDCHWTQVSDLSPLKGMLLTELNCVGSRVVDLTPLKSVPLISLGFDFKVERDAEILRSMKTLERINGKPATDLWKEVDAKATNKKP